MSVAGFKVPLLLEELHGLARRDEVVRTGVPLPRGLVRDATALAVADEAGAVLPHQVRVLAMWPDRSIKWALVDLLVSIGAREARKIFLQPSASRVDAAVAPPGRLVLTESADELEVDTGRARFIISRHQSGPIAAVSIDGMSLLRERGMRVLLRSADGTEHEPRFERVSVEERGPVKLVLRLEGRVECGRRAGWLSFESRLAFVAGSGAVRMEILLRNPRAARHFGGLWDLGDPGSVCFDDLSLNIHPLAGAREICWYSQVGAPFESYSGERWSLYQDSSGGERWSSRNHVDKEGRLTVSFRGYRVFAGHNGANQEIAAGQRATPCVSVAGDGLWMAATVDAFWQNFPKALRWNRDTLSIGLFPAETHAGFELQGGEQKRHTVWLDFGRDGHDTIISHLQTPIAASVDTAWIESSRVIPYLVRCAQDANTPCSDYVQRIVAGTGSFFAKRELIDEYGWRHFGELYGDHEAVNHPGPEPLVSHYNNQYDFIYGALVQYLRTGDQRWRELMDGAARHTIDIDIYHTGGDKPAFNGGLFWHTDHYKPAATCTHRTYSRYNRGKGAYGGGPSNEHNYTSGLLHYHFLTGDPEAARAVVGLADWVLAMDDGSQTLLGLIDSGPTGYASKTVTEDYHKPGRGAGNSINALLDAYSLTHERLYMAKAEELIQRCIHPSDDIDALELSQPEHRWSYLVFLQVLGKYLDTKVSLGEADYTFYYARDSLLHYARWMRTYEVPYKDVLDRVELPTETWPAHDVRKCHVLHVAAKYAPEAERSGLHERAAFFFSRSIDDVLGFPTAGLTRPLVIFSVYGFVQAYFESHPAESVPYAEHGYAFGEPARFVPQKARVVAALRTKSRVAVLELRRMFGDACGTLRRRFISPRGGG